MQDDLAAILDELGGHGDPAATNLNVVGLGTVLGSPLTILQVAGIGGLKDRDALIYVIAGVCNVGRLVNVAALGFLAYRLTEIAVLEVVVVAVAVAGVVTVVVRGGTPEVAGGAIPAVATGVVPVVVARVVLILLFRDNVSFVVSLLVGVCAIGFLRLDHLLRGFVDAFVDWRRR